MKQNFEFDPSLERFTLSQRRYLEEYQDPTFNYIATGAFVFASNPGPQNRILLLQRAATDSMPNRWEVPGGGCDDEDDSILSAAARELWEEAGIETEAIMKLIGIPHLFSTRSGKKICKFNFWIKARRDSSGRLEVKRDPQEHQNFIWATEEEVRTKSCGDISLEFTTSHQELAILEAFKEVTQ